jgi:predicted transposase YdaD
MGIEEILIEDARQEGEIRGEIRGEIKGEIRGEIRGIEKGFTLLISNVIKKHPKWSDEKIADLLEVSIDTVKSVRANL